MPLATELESSMAESRYTCAEAMIACLCCGAQLVALAVE